MAKIDEFDVTIRLMSGKYVAAIPQLGLFGGGVSARAALDQLDKKKERLIADLTEIDMAAEIDVAPDLPSIIGASQAALEIPGPTLLREVVGFGLKALILVGFLSIGLSVGSNSVIENARLSAKGVADQFQHVGGAGFWKKVLNDIDKLAESDMPADQKEHVLAQMRVIVQKWQPFVAEGAKLFAVDQPPVIGSRPK